MTRRIASGLRPDVEPRHGGAARVGAEQGREDPDGRGLARAVRAEQAEDGALLDHEVDAVERADLVLAAAVDLDQALGDDRLRALRRGDHDRARRVESRQRWRDLRSCSGHWGQWRIDRRRAAGEGILPGLRRIGQTPTRERSARQVPPTGIVAVLGPAAVGRRSRSSNRQGAAPPPGRRAARAGGAACPNRAARSIGWSPARRRTTTRDATRAIAGTSDRMDARSNTGWLQGWRGSRRTGIGLGRRGRGPACPLERTPSQAPFFGPETRRRDPGSDP